MCRRLIMTALIFTSLMAVEQPYPWQRPHATVDPTGDLVWKPEPYRYRPGDSIRYIDYADGSDQGDGSKAQPWKHHPWDENATANAAAASGVDTFVFKGGVAYRGHLEVATSGSPDRPIQLCSDPAWGDGPAGFYGSEAVSGWRRGGAHADTPAKDLVWTVEVDWLPRTVWVVPADGEAIRIPLARTPNWRVEGRDDIKAGWWTWTNKGVHHFKSSRKVGNRTLNFAVDHVNLTDEILEHAKGATVWSEYGWVMGTPFPSHIHAVDKKMQGIAFGSQWSDNSRSHIVTHCRYYLENAPYFLDDPQGEHWVEKIGENRARIHLIFPAGLDPSSCRVEVGRHQNLIRAEQQSHLRIAGLDFRYINAGWDLNRQGTGGAIGLRGPFENIEVANCSFTDLGGALGAGISGETGSIDGLVFRDNDVLRTDSNLMSVSSADGWGMADGPFAYVENISVLRNRGRNIGMRPSRFGQGHAFNFTVVRSLHAAGNILDMCWAAGIFVYGGKNIQSNDDVPFARILIHHNKVTNALLNSNDWGGIETWQGGPAYIFNNVVGDIRGYWHYNYMGSSGERRNASFGHAYYLDGGFKNYLFNNIAYGRTDDWSSPYQTCAAFQEIYSYQNAFFNNTAFRFRIGSRRQRPEAGRNAYLGNIFEGVDMLFRHSDAKEQQPEANIEHAGEQDSTFAYDTNAYGSNLLHNVGRMGLFEATGIVRNSPEEFAQALAAHKALRSDAATVHDTSLLPAGADHDFTPAAAVDGKGVRYFVPWALHGTVAEWNFYPSQEDGRIIDEHWYMTPNYAGRGDYYKQPMWPLMPAAGQGAEVAIDGPLEDWVAGAVAFDGSERYYVLSNDTLAEPITYTTNNRGGPKRGQRNEYTLQGADNKNPEIYTSNLLIEVFFKAEGDGILIEKMDDQAGYGVAIVDGKAVFTFKHAGQERRLVTAATLANGEWHHLIVEADRAAESMTAYVDGQQNASGPGFGPVSLANESDLFVGGSPAGRHLTGAIDFMRIAQGTLADAQTTIGELYAWQFDGPMVRDFSGREPRGDGRDAGAIEAH